jgi:hypothetical protein
MKKFSLTLAFTLGLSVIAYVSSASAQTVANQTFGRCVFTERAAMSRLISEEIKKDLVAKGFEFPAAAVTFSNIKSVRKAVSLADFTGVTGVTPQADGSYLANVTGKIGSVCEMQATLGIRVSGFNKTTQKRFSFFKTQQVTLTGSYQ